MVFVLGLFLIAVGVYAITYTLTEIRYISPFDSTPYAYYNYTHPYVSVGIVMTVIGIIPVLVALLEVRRGKFRRMVNTQGQPPPPPN
jgi:hypothetical protein